MQQQLPNGLKYDNNTSQLFLWANSKMSTVAIYIPVLTFKIYYTYITINKYECDDNMLI